MEMIRKIKAKLPTKDDILRVYKKSPIKLVDLFVWGMLLLMAFVFLYPFIHMITTSFKSYSDLLNVTIKWLPKNPTLENYAVALKVMRLGDTLPNSLIVTILTTVGHVFVCSFIAYGFSRFDFPLKGTLFGIVILSILVPIQTIIIPMYTTYANLSFSVGEFTFKMLGTYWPLIFPCFLGYGLKGGLFIFLYRQYFLGIPKALEEAATIDGCGPVKTFFKIAFPSAGSTTIVCIVLSMVWHWNDYYEPSLYLNEYDQMLLPQIVASLKALVTEMQRTMIDGSGSTTMSDILYHEGTVMAGTFFSMVPPMAGYLILQRRFMEGIEHSGLTGM